MTVSEKMIEAAARADAQFAGRTFDGLSGQEKTRYRQRAALMLAAAMEVEANEAALRVSRRLSALKEPTHE